MGFIKPGPGAPKVGGTDSAGLEAATHEPRAPERAQRVTASSQLPLVDFRPPVGFAKLPHVELRVVPGAQGRALF
jgi:hypothetical protein